MKVPNLMADSMFSANADLTDEIVRLVACQNFIK